MRWLRTCMRDGWQLRVAMIASGDHLLVGAAHRNRVAPELGLEPHSDTTLMRRYPFAVLDVGRPRNRSGWPMPGQLEFGRPRPARSPRVRVKREHMLNATAMLDAPASARARLMCNQEKECGVSRRLVRRDRRAQAPAGVTRMGGDPRLDTRATARCVGLRPTTVNEIWRGHDGWRDSTRSCHLAEAPKRAYRQLSRLKPEKECVMRMRR